MEKHMIKHRIMGADNNTPDSYDSYKKAVDDAIEDIEDRRKKATAICIKVYNYLMSASDYLDSVGYLESALDAYEDIDAPDTYGWFDTVPNAVADKAYDEYEKFYADAEEVDEINDIIEDVKVLIDKMYQKLAWVEGEQ